MPDIVFFELKLVAGEIFLLSGAMVILLIDLFLSDEKRDITYYLSIIVLVISGCLIAGAGEASVYYPFSGMVIIDSMAIALKMLVCVLAVVCMIYSRSYLLVRGIFKGEFFVLTLFATLGMLIMISANHLLLVYLGIELLSLSLYTLVAFDRDKSKSAEAAIKYFVLGALASGLLLYGMSMLYGATGTLNLNEISMLVSDGQVVMTLALFGLVFIVSGLAFKLGAVPFHMWVPDVYQGSPTAVVLLIGSMPKIATYVLFVRILMDSLGAERMFFEWQQMLMILGVASILIGNIVAIAQTNIKRMLAYSAIAHMGFLLLALATGDREGASAAMFYVVVYAFTAVGTFGMIMFLSMRGFEAENIEDFKGLNRRSPVFAFVMLLLMFSMAGIPPTVGFWAKLSVLQVLIDQGYLWIAVFAVILSLIGAFYYLRIIKMMYFDKASSDDDIIVHPGTGFVLAGNGLLVLFFGVFPSLVFNFCKNAIAASF